MNTKLDRSWIEYTEKSSAKSRIIKKIVKLVGSFVGSRTLQETRDL